MGSSSVNLVRRKTFVEGVIIPAKKKVQRSDKNAMVAKSLSDFKQYDTYGHSVLSKQQNLNFFED